jgi:L-ascorbate metabolism protein UlaG (beta-lactamase superfamily)
MSLAHVSAEEGSWLPVADPRAARLREFLASTDDGSFYVGHAFVLVRVSGRKYLVDCVFPRRLFLDAWVFFPSLVLDPALLDVDGVFISHCHEDHYDPAFLARLRPGTPIYVTEGRIGFSEILDDPRLDVRAIAPGKLHTIDSALRVLALASDHNPIDSSFVLKGAGLSVYQGNDNFLDRDTMVRARDIAGPVDHAYIPYAYVWWYPFCLTSIADEHRDAEIARLSRKSMELGLMIADTLEAQVVIPSAGNLVFADHAESIINRGIATPFDFAEFAAGAAPKNSSRRIEPLLGGDYVLKTRGVNTACRANVDKAAYFRTMSHFLAELRSREKAVAPRAHIEPGEAAFLAARLDDVRESFECDLVFMRDDLPGEAIRADLRAMRVSVESGFRPAGKHISFRIQPIAFEAWLRGDASFETILNSQRFHVERQPEIFDREIWELIRTRL